MGFTFGDILGFVALLIGVCLSAWATLLAFSLLFPGRAEQAAVSIRQSPSMIGLRGLGLTLVMVFVAVILFKIPNPLIKAIAWLDLLSMLSLAALGGSGLAMLIARRVRDQEPQLSAYAALMRGAALVVVPGLLPVFGWFLVTPIMLVVGIGAGTKALRLAPLAGHA
jgi:hypothetical protein